MTALTIDIQGPQPPAEVAAAIVTAIERFVADTTRPVEEAVPKPSPWFQAGLLEAAGHDPEHRFLTVPTA
ncbi:MAG TPA: hypothetical protein VNT22_00320 [Baekduia sp.]|nr:hypothetical protein [Baekduia sp.]